MLRKEIFVSSYTLSKLGLVMDQTDWSVIETQFDFAELHHKETLFTLGNGYLGTRGTFEEGYP
jgi:kojibiose phosphorylase